MTEIELEKSLEEFVNTLPDPALVKKFQNKDIGERTYSTQISSFCFSSAQIPRYTLFANNLIYDVHERTCKIKTPDTPEGERRDFIDDLLDKTCSGFL